MGESFSNHPIAKSILKTVKEEVDTSKVENFQEIPGKGLQYQYMEKIIKIGNQELIKEKGLEVSLDDTTSLYLIVNNEKVAKEKEAAVLIELVARLDAKIWEGN